MRAPVHQTMTAVGAYDNDSDNDDERKEKNGRNGEGWGHINTSVIQIYMPACLLTVRAFSM